MDVHEAIDHLSKEDKKRFDEVLKPYQKAYYEGFKKAHSKYCESIDPAFIIFDEERTRLTEQYKKDIKTAYFEFEKTRKEGNK